MKEHTLYSRGATADISSSTRYVLFTHTDLDGAGCAVVYAHYHDIAEIHYCNNGDDINNAVREFIAKAIIDKDTKYSVVIADQSVNEEVACMIDECVNNNDNIGLLLVDHHESALWLNKYEWARVDTTMCGTTLLLKHYSNIASYKYENKVLNRYAIDVEDRDLWRWESKKNMNSLFHHKLLCKYGIINYVIRISRRIDTGVNIITDKECSDIQIDIDSMNAYVNSNINNYIKDKITVGDNTYYVAFTFASAHVSELGNAICTEHNDIDICCIICVNRGEHGSVELRSVKDDVDLSVIAKALGGGGHIHAAGFPLTEDFMKGIIGSFSNMMSIK